MNLFGITTSGAATVNLDLDRELLSDSFEIDVEVTLAKLTAYVDGLRAGGNDQEIVATLRDADGDLLAYSDPVIVEAGQTAGWVDWSFPTPRTIEPGDYYFGLLGGAGNAARAYGTDDLSGRVGTDTYSDGPSATLPAGTSQRTNYYTNPTGETAAKFSSVGDFVVTREAETGPIPAYKGSYRDKHAFDGTGTDTRLWQSATFTFPSAGTYTMSCYVWVPANWDGGMPWITTDATYTGATETLLNAANTSLRDQWQRISTRLAVVGGDLAGTIVGRCNSGGGMPSSSGTGILYTDGMMVENATTATAYFSGANPGSPQSGWTGTAHASTSVSYAIVGPSVFATYFYPWSAPDLPDLDLARYGFYTAQAAIGTVAADPRTRKTVEASWHGTRFDPERQDASFAIAQLDGDLTDYVGQRVKITEANTERSVIAYIHREADLDLDDEQISLSRRLFAQLAPLSTDKLLVTVEALGPEDV